MLYHVNPATGNAGKCTAHQGKCPFGSENEHYTSQESAQQAYEKKMSKELPKTTGRGKNFTKELTDELRLWGTIPPVNGRPFQEVWLEHFKPLENYSAEELAKPARDITELLTPPLTLTSADLMTGYSSRRTFYRESTLAADPTHDYVIFFRGSEVSTGDDVALRSHPAFLGAEEEEEDDYSYNDPDTTYYFNLERSGQEVEDFQKKANDLRQAQQLNKSLQAIKERSLTPWSALQGRSPAVNSAQDYSDQWRQREGAAHEAQEHKAARSALRAKVERGEAENSEVEALGTPNVWYIKNKLKEFKESSEKAREAGVVASAIDELPDDSPIKQYYVKDRGSFEHTYTEKVGRRNVKKTKMVKRNSHLETLRETEATYTRFSESERKALLRAFDEAVDKVDYKHEAALRDLASLKELRLRSWSAYWPTGATQAPEVPDFFLPHS